MTMFFKYTAWAVQIDVNVFEPTAQVIRTNDNIFWMGSSSNWHGNLHDNFSWRDSSSRLNTTNNSDNDDGSGSGRGSGNDNDIDNDNDNDVNGSNGDDKAITMVIQCTCNSVNYQYEIT